MGRPVLAVSATLAMMWKSSFNSSEPAICTSIEPNKIVPENYLTKVLWPKENYVSVWSCKLKLSIPIGFEPAICASIEHNEIVPETYLNQDYGLKKITFRFKALSWNWAFPSDWNQLFVQVLGSINFTRNLFLRWKLAFPSAESNPRNSFILEFKIWILRH